ncbi:hypothetical protein GPECTOR_7g1148 [Gonium pectorale]|uniref:Methyltransferase type 11 domain-containing protein n=1 Tax=Gonium pectorale TaxID=33097 RepID=A0A150GTZ5_GONPE|nr:hypothetical protein GPECTOR_7g1148 [Gonium pectorale]|eukprot:KXZ53254.1 hypothetical protein GPECTOR_7g1148 [Gonium pectorale]
MRSQTAPRASTKHHTASPCGRKVLHADTKLGSACRRGPEQRWPSVAAGASQAGRGGTIVREVLSGPERTKLDPGDDRAFYDVPRFVKHVDKDFLDKVTELYRQRIPEGGAVLDLCSSWVSHLPPEVAYGKVVGHGMNAAELARNPRLDSFFVRNLNREPDGWAAADSSFDAVLCCVSVQYMQQPERVFAEVYRVLKPGGVFIITFSNRLFYTKAIAAWRDASGYARCQLVKQYFQSVAGFTEPEVLTEVQPAGKAAAGAGGPLGALLGALGPLGGLLRRSSSDPFYAVVAYRNFKRE